MNDIFEDLLGSEEVDKNFSANENKISLLNNTKEIQCLIHNESKNLTHQIVMIDLESSTTIIQPLNTIIDSPFYFKSKYVIKEFIFEGLDTSFEVLEYGGYAIYGLPNGFTKTIAYGLGLEKKYKVLIETIQKHFGKCIRLIISNKKETSIISEGVIINRNDFEKLRRGIDRNHDLFQRESKIAKESFIYENIFNYLDPIKYPKLEIPSRKEVIYKILRNTDYSKISKSDKSSLSTLKDNTDLSYLTVLRNEFEEKINGNHLEATYQSFFEQNPLLLTFFSGSPFVQFKNKAYVGGKSFDNSNGQYPDFLQKHKLTRNTFIIEIKTPQTLLLDKSAYRDTGVYNPSKHLSGSITQLLTQKYQLETEISTLIKNAEDRDVEAYNVQSLLIIGSLSCLTSKETIRSFELFRNNQKNLRIITYDECLEQLKIFISLLSKRIEENKDENEEDPF